MHPLVAEAMKKAAIAWITVDLAPAYPVWCLWIDDALYVVSGGGEQPAPGLAAARRASVSTRGDHGGRIVTWAAEVDAVIPSDDAWAEVTTQLAGKRLNASGSNEGLVERWVAGSLVSRLRPAGDEIAVASTGSGATPPKPSPAVRHTSKPFRLHRVKRR